MKFIVAGASGAFRRPLMERFVYVGHQATGIVRSPAEAHDLVRLGVELLDLMAARLSGRFRGPNWSSKTLTREPHGKRMRVCFRSTVSGSGRSAFHPTSPFAPLLVQAGKPCSL